MVHCRNKVTIATSQLTVFDTAAVLQAISPAVLASVGTELGRGQFGVVSEVPWAGTTCGRAALKTCVVKERFVQAFAQEGSILAQLHAISGGVGAVQVYGMGFTAGPAEGTVHGHLMMDLGRGSLLARAAKQVAQVRLVGTGRTQFMCMKYSRIGGVRVRGLTEGLGCQALRV